MRKPTQAERILALLEERDSVTNLELNRICFRYGARIHDLREDGHNITSKRLKQGVWEFRLNKEPKQLTLV